MFNSLTHENRYDNLRFLCLFIGYPRSGHSVIGALLDAHENIAITHEFNILSKFKDFHTKEELFESIIENAKQNAETGRISYQYSYKMPDLSQGSVKVPIVLGDKMGSKTTLLLYDDYTLLAQLESFCSLPIKLIHVVRNPFDIITTKAGYYNGTRAPITLPNLEKAIIQIEKEAIINQDLLRKLSERILTIKHEDLILKFEETVHKLFNHLELEASEEFVQNARKYVYMQPKPSRYKYDWPKTHIHQVEKSIIQDISFMNNYTY